MLELVNKPIFTIGPFSKNIINRLANGLDPIDGPKSYVGICSAILKLNADRSRMICGCSTLPVVQQFEVKKDIDLISDAINKLSKIEVASNRVFSLDDNDEIINKLNKMVSDEFISANQYLCCSIVVQGKANPSIAKEFEEHSKDEFDHFTRLLERIQELGGTPEIELVTLVNNSYNGVPRLNNSDSANLLTIMFNAEMSAVKSYKLVYDYLKDRDPGTALIVLEIINKEQEHAHDLDQLGTELGMHLLDSSKSDLIPSDEIVSLRTQLVPYIGNEIKLSDNMVRSLNTLKVYLSGVISEEYTIKNILNNLAVKNYTDVQDLIKGILFYYENLPPEIIAKIKSDWVTPAEVNMNNEVNSSESDKKLESEFKIVRGPNKVSMEKVSKTPDGSFTKVEGKSVEFDTEDLPKSTGLVDISSSPNSKSINGLDTLKANDIIGVKSIPDDFMRLVKVNDINPVANTIVIRGNDMSTGNEIEFSVAEGTEFPCYDEDANFAQPPVRTVYVPPIQPGQTYPYPYYQIPQQKKSSLGKKLLVGGLAAGALAAGAGAVAGKGNIVKGWKGIGSGAKAGWNDARSGKDGNAFTRFMKGTAGGAKGALTGAKSTFESSGPWFQDAKDKISDIKGKYEQRKLDKAYERQESAKKDRELEVHEAGLKQLKAKEAYKKDADGKVVKVLVGRDGKELDEADVMNAGLARQARFKEIAERRNALHKKHEAQAIENERRSQSAVNGLAKAKYIHGKGLLGGIGNTFIAAGKGLGYAGHGIKRALVGKTTVGELEDKAANKAAKSEFKAEQAKIKAAVNKDNKDRIAAWNKDLASAKDMMREYVKNSNPSKAEIKDLQAKFKAKWGRNFSDDSESDFSAKDVFKKALIGTAIVAPIGVATYGAVTGKGPLGSLAVTDSAKDSYLGKQLAKANIIKDKYVGISDPELTRADKTALGKIKQSMIKVGTSAKDPALTNKYLKHENKKTELRFSENEITIDDKLDYLMK